MRPLRLPNRPCPGMTVALSRSPPKYLIQTDFFSLFSTTSPHHRIEGLSSIKLPIPHCVVRFQPNCIFLVPRKDLDQQKKECPSQRFSPRFAPHSFFELATFGYQQAALPTKSASAQAAQQAVPRCDNCSEMVHAILFGRGLQFCSLIISLFD